MDDELVGAVLGHVDQFARALITVEEHAASPFLSSSWFIDSPADPASPLARQVVDYLRAELGMEPGWTTIEDHQTDKGLISNLTWFGGIWPLVVMTQPPRATPHGSCVHVRLLVPTFRFEDAAVGQHYATLLNGQSATSFAWLYSPATATLAADASMLVAPAEQQVSGLTVTVGRLRQVALETYGIAVSMAAQLYQLLRDDGTVGFSLATTKPPSGTFRTEGSPLAVNAVAHMAGHAGQYGNQWPELSPRQLLEDYLETLPTPVREAFLTTLRLDEELAPQARLPSTTSYAVRVPFPEQDQLAFIFVAPDTNPTVGDGLMLRLETPYRIEDTSVPEVIEGLHRHEISAGSGMPMLGFWFTWPSGSGSFKAAAGEHTLSFGTFLPSIRAGHVDPTEVVGQLFRRARLLRELFGPTQPPPAPPLRVDHGGR